MQAYICIINLYMLVVATYSIQYYMLLKKYYYMSKDMSRRKIYA